MQLGARKGRRWGKVQIGGANGRTGRTREPGSKYFQGFEQVGLASLGDAGAGQLLSCSAAAAGGKARGEARAVTI